MRSSSSSMGFHRVGECIEFGAVIMEAVLTIRLI
jgi:hypothetical protein